MLDDLIGGTGYRWRGDYSTQAKNGKIPPKERSQDSFPWSFFEQTHAKPPYFAPSLLSYGDYDNSGLVERSNQRVFREQFAQLQHREWWLLIGSHDSSAVILRRDADERHEDLREFFEHLNDSVYADEDDHSQLVMDAEVENWADYGAADYRRAIEEFLAPDLPPSKRWMSTETRERFLELLDQDGNLVTFIHALWEWTGQYPEPEGVGTATIFPEFSADRHGRGLAARVGLDQLSAEDWERFTILFEQYTNEHAAALTEDPDHQQGLPGRVTRRYWGSDGIMRNFIDQAGVPEKDEAWRQEALHQWEAHGRRTFKGVLLNQLRYRGDVPDKALADTIETRWDDYVFDLLFWNVIEPAWGAKLDEQWPLIISRNGYINFRAEYALNIMFNRRRDDPGLAILLDAVVEGQNPSMFVPIVQGWFEADFPAARRER